MDFFGHCLDLGEHFLSGQETLEAGDVGELEHLESVVDFVLTGFGESDCDGIWGFGDEATKFELIAGCEEGFGSFCSVIARGGHLILLKKIWGEEEKTLVDFFCSVKMLNWKANSFVVL